MPKRLPKRHSKRNKLLKANQLFMMGASQYAHRALSWICKTAVTTAVFLCVTLSFSRVCKADASTVLPSTDAVVSSSIAEPTTLNPLLATDTASAGISSLIFDGLLRYNENFELETNLAARYDISSDGKVITFYLRKDVLWQDGHSFSAADVIFTIDCLNSEKLASVYASDFQKIEKIQSPNPHTLIVSYKEAFSPALASWTMGILPSHLGSIDAILSPSFSRKPIGTGPYKLKSWKSGQLLELEANARYFRAPVGIRRYYLRIIPEQSVAFLELLSGSLDIQALNPLQDQKMTQSRNFQKNFDKYRYASTSYLYFGYNLDRLPFNEPRVRLALDLALDKTKILQSVFRGRASALSGPFLPSSWAYDASLKPRDYDPERAKRLLQECGYRDSDHDGILDKNGQKLRFEILTNQGDDQRSMLCQIAVDYWRQIGVDARMRTVAWNVFLKDHVDKRNFDVVLLAWQLSPEPDVYDLFHSSKTKPGEFNFVAYRNKHVDTLLEAARKTHDQDERKKIYHRAHRLIFRDNPYLFLCVPQSIVAIHKRYENVQEAPAGPLKGLLDWRVQTSRVKYKL